MAVSSDSQGFYRLLGVPRTASRDEIKAAFRERAKLYHPDRGGGEADEERFRLLRDAYEVLRDPHRRLQYDAEELDAERRRDRARHAAAAGGAEGGPGASPRARPGWVLPAAGLGGALLLVGLVAAASLAVGRGREEERLRAELAELRLGLGAAGAAGPARAVDEDGQDVLYTASFAFPPDSAEVEGGLAAELDNRLAELLAAVSALPPEGGWSLLIDGRSPRAASEAGVAVEDWELTLLRVATLTDHLVRATVPAGRLAVRFRAGLAPPGAPPDDGRTVEVSLLCCGP